MAEPHPDHFHEFETEREPLGGLVLPADRVRGAFDESERVIVFAPVTNAQRNLKRGTVERLSEDGWRVTVRLDVPPPKINRTSKSSFAEQGRYSVGLRQPLLMREAEYEALFGSEERVRAWVASGYVESERLRDELSRKLLRVGVSDSIVSTGGVEQEVRTGLSGRRRVEVRRIRTDSGSSS